jgi:hypothetical protein
MENNTKHYCRPVVLNLEYLEPFKKLFDRWKSPSILGKIYEDNEIFSEPDYENILEEEEKLLDIVGDRPMPEESFFKNTLGFSDEHELCKVGVDILKKIYPNKEIISKGAVYYAPNSFMNWHTNSNCEGKRVYISWSAEEGKNFFRYRTGGKTTTVYEDKGLCIREFNITKEKPFWHCVGCSTHRFSMGFLINEKI